MKVNKRAVYTALIPLFILTVFAFIMKAVRSDDDALVVYCSHDSVFAEAILEKFTKETGIKVIPRFDTEASKSLGLTEKIILEGSKSECDVYWSNEIFSMPVLAEEGLLDPWKGSGWERIPAEFKDADGLWTGFAARLRVWIINTDNMKADPQLIDSKMKSADLSKVAVALPLYGTTLTHFACLWRDLGKEKLQEKYRLWKRSKVQIVPGNGPSRNLVAAGTCDFGLTDTDDFFGAVDKKAPVAMLPVRLPDNSTICIPNTVGMMKSSSKKDKARKFIDFLLSENTEVELANSSSRQIPLGKTDQQLPDEVRKLIPFAREGTDMLNLISIREPLLNWLKEEENLK